MIKVILAMVLAVLTMIFPIFGMACLLKWHSHVKKNNPQLLQSLQRKALFRDKFLSPKLFFPYCFRKDNKDDKISASYKRKYIYSMMLWLILFIVTIILYKA